MQNVLLLISGIPASGKSYFCKWLKQKYSYVHFDVDTTNFDIGKSRGTDLTDFLNLWERCYRYKEVNPFIQALQQLQRPVVIDWGFPVRFLGLVDILKQNGFSIWWFDANLKQSRDAFIKRGGISLQAYDKQMDDISRHKVEIDALFTPHIIRTLNAQGKRTRPEAIYREIYSTLPKT